MSAESFLDSLDVFLVLGGILAVLFLN